MTYFIRHGAKKLDNVTIVSGVGKTEKKDPFGITLTEMNHLDKVMDESFHLTLEDHNEIEKQITATRHK